MTQYQEIMPGVYQIIPDSIVDIQAADERLKNLREKLIADYEKFYSGQTSDRSIGTCTPS
jgi:hypothetical protein